MKLNSRVLAIGLASAALVASGTAFAKSEHMHMHTTKASAFCGRTVVGKNGRLLGVINETQNGPGGTGQLYLYTTSDIGLKGKVVTLPQTMFKGQGAEPGYMILKAPKLTASALRKMPAAMGVISAG